MLLLVPVLPVARRIDTMERRSFLRNAGAAAVALNLNPAAMGANERVTLALIGGRNQGRHVARRTIEAGGRFKTFCDIDSAIAAKFSPDMEKQQDAKIGYERDFRRVLDDKDIDAVVIATPDHWHTHMSLLALAAGKDCYIEKPLSQTIREGQMIRDATRKYNRIVQVGTQRRSGEHFQLAAAYAASGKLGKVCLVKAWMCQLRESIGTPLDGTAPETVDYDQWLGPAPKRPFNVNRFHYNWRFFWDYGNTELGNQGIHLLDVALSGIQKMKGTLKALPKRISSNGGIYWLDDAKEVPDMQVTTYDYGDLMLMWELRSFARHHAIENTSAGTSFHGTDATLVVDGRGWRVFDKANKIAEEHEDTPLLHEQNFLECLRGRKAPIAEVEIGRLSTTLCHLGNVSQRLRRDVVFDAETETFGSDEQANAMLTKQYRAEYPLPKV
jgi:predicted dehydrogenase